MDRPIFCLDDNFPGSAGELDRPIARPQVEDGPGRPLGRSFRVKLWPTLVFLRDGKEVARAVRPTDADEVRRALAAIAGEGG